MKRWYASPMNAFLYSTLLGWCDSGAVSLILTLGCVRPKSLQLCWTLCGPMDCIAHQATLSTEFSRQEYWSGLPCPPPGDLSDPGIEPGSLASRALAGGFFTTSTTELGFCNLFALSGSANKGCREREGGISTSPSFPRLSTPSQ